MDSLRELLLSTAPKSWLFGLAKAHIIDASSPLLARMYAVEDS
jgi:hypothetical protein